MGAPKGNEFWKLRSRHGREKLFASPELLWQAACEYFKWCEDNPIEAQDNKGTRNVNVVKFKRPYTKEGFFLYVDAWPEWYYEFKKRVKDDEGFMAVIHKIDQTIRKQKLEGAVIGIYNANIVARDIGLAEKIEADHTLNIPKLPDIIIK